MSSAVGAALVVWKIGRPVVVGLIGVFHDPARAASWVADHWVLVAGGCAVIFALAFLTIRLGIEVADRWLRFEERIAAPDEVPRGEGLGPTTGRGWDERQATTSSYLPGRG